MCTGVSRICKRKLCRNQLLQQRLGLGVAARQLPLFFGKLLRLLEEELAKIDLLLEERHLLWLVLRCRASEDHGFLQEHVFFVERCAKLPVQLAQTLFVLEVELATRIDLLFQAIELGLRAGKNHAREHGGKW